MDILKYSQHLFEEMINCQSDKIDEDGYFTLGETRFVEVREFIDKFMQTWVNQQEFKNVTLSSSPATVQLLYKNRFCTYSEYEKLFSSPHEKYDTIIFTMLGIDNEQKRAKYKDLFTKDLDGYFRLMKVINPPLGTFFFPAVHS